MGHLSEDRLVDLLEGEPEATGHLDRCPACRARLDALRTAMRMVRRSDGEAPGDVPEPSPLFWPHLSERIGQAVRETPARRSGWRTLQVGGVGLATAAAIMLFVAVGLEPVNRRLSPVPATLTSGALPLGDMTWVRGVDDDGAWDVVLGVAGQLERGAAVEINLRPGSVDQAFLTLTAEEQSALADMLRDEIARVSS